MRLDVVLGEAGKLLDTFEFEITYVIANVAPEFLTDCHQLIV